MATRFRKILWITTGVVLAPILVAATYIAILALRPAPPLQPSRLLAPPGGLKASSGRGQVTISWDRVPGALSYRVYRSDGPEGTYRPLGSALSSAPVLVRLFLGRALPQFHLSAPPYVDTLVDDRTHYYRVRAFDGTGWSEPSNPLPATAEPGSAGVWLSVDASRAAGPLNHVWELAIGSEHPAYYLKEDAGRGLRNAGVALRRANKRLHDAFGIRYVRAHGVLMDALASYRESADGKPVTDWSRIDLVYDMMRNDGLRPIVELSFMPAALAADPTQTIFSYRGITSPPKDYRKWADFVGAFARHLIQRYGREEVVTWPFEVWNEPDLSIPFLGTFWHGSIEDYYRLYDFSAAALKGADPRIPVGGPVAAKVESIEPFLKHVTAARAAAGGGGPPLDFLSVHVYSGLPLDFRTLCERYGVPQSNSCTADSAFWE
jgi:xylan 1,4-beta-xylosidase